MSTYYDCQMALKTILEGVAGINRVYATPPGTVQNMPAIVLYGSMGQADFTFGSGFGGPFLTVAPEQTNVETFTLFVSDAKLEEATRLVWEFNEKIKAAIAANGALLGHGNAKTIQWERPMMMMYAGKEYSGQTYMLSFVVQP